MRNFNLFVLLFSIGIVFTMCSPEDSLLDSQENVETRQKDCCRSIDVQFESSPNWTIQLGSCCVTRLIINFGPRTECVESVEIFKNGEFLMNLGDNMSMQFTEEVCTNSEDGSTYSIYVNGEFCRDYTMPGNINCIEDACDEAQIDIANQIGNGPMGTVENEMSLVFLNNYFSLDIDESYDDIQFLDCYKEKLGDFYFGDVENCEDAEIINLDLVIGNNIMIFGGPDQNISPNSAGTVLGIMDTSVDALNVELDEIGFCSDGDIYIQNISFSKLGNCNNPDICDYIASYRLVCCN